MINKERRGDYLGGTIQVVPHVTNEMKRRIVRAAQHLEADVAIVEIGGTVGDIEGQPFLEAIRQLKKDIGRENVLYIHITLLPYLHASGELKTKPTQHSVRELRGLGIQPHIIGLRADCPIDDEIRDKISLFCDVEPRAVIPIVTASNIYEVPLLLEETGLGDLVVEKLGLQDQVTEPALEDWKEVAAQMKAEKPPVHIALVGKYVALQDAYISVRESLTHAAMKYGHSVEIDWVNSEELERDKGLERLEKADGIIVPGGFGYRGIEGKIIAARYAREHKVPYLGLCLGMQVMCIEFARYASDNEKANSEEFDPSTKLPIISLMPDQHDMTEMGGTMRLGAYPCKLQPGTHAHDAYGLDEVQERHRHRFEFNNTYRDLLQEAGMVFSGLSPNGRLVEIAELKEHPWMVGSQFHPEFKSRPHRPHPLFCGFVKTAIQYQKEQHNDEK